MRKIYFGSGFQRNLRPLWQERPGDFMLQELLTEAPSITEDQEAEREE